MSYEMDYSTPSTITQSGRDAFNDGAKRGDCPISRRPCANGIYWWLSGWDEAREEAENTCTCKGGGCAAIDGVGHSDECEREHEGVSRGQRR